MCGCSLKGTHLNVKYCQSADCRAEQKRKNYAVRNFSTKSVYYQRQAVTGVYCPTIYSMPAGTVGSGRAHWHVGTNYDPDAQAHERKSALSWLLKGRKPERMNPAKIKVNVRQKSWRESHAESLAAVRKSGVVA